jgi:transcriptional regulator with XRE-family HTH domain
MADEPMNEEHQPDTVGRRIGKIARERGVKAKDLEKVSGLDRGSVGKLLRGERGSTSLEAGLKIARFLKIDPYALLPETAGGSPIEHIVKRMDLRARWDGFEDALRVCESVGIDPYKLAFSRPKGKPDRALIARFQKFAEHDDVLHDALDTVEAESRLPEGPSAEVVRDLQTEIDAVREIAEKAMAEAKQARGRGRGKTA